MDFSILQSPDDALKFLGDVIASADKHKDELGFLPPAAYEGQAAKGRLWILTDENSLYAGHLMFGGYKQALKITQMYVSAQHRGRGLATQAIEALKSHAQKSGCQYIQARVGADMSANEFWEKHGFSIVDQVKGGETTKRLINVRAWFVPDSGLFETPLSDSNLFSSRPLVTSKLPSYVLDTNIVIDVARKREASDDIERLLARSISQELRLRSTPELGEELRRGDEYADDDVAVRLAALIGPLARLSDSKLDGYIEKLYKTVFPDRHHPKELTKNQRSDLIHLAYCIEYQQNAFITRDGPVLRAANLLSQMYGLEILTPFDLIPADSIRYDVMYGENNAPDVSFSWVPAEHAKQIIHAAYSEHLKDHISKISPDWTSRDDANQRLLLISLADQTVGCAFVMWNPNDTNWEIVLSPIKSFPISRNLIDAVLQHIYEMCRIGHCSTVSIALSTDSVESYEQAVKSGFKASGLPNEGVKLLRLTRPIFKGCIGRDTWPSIVSGFRRSLGWKLTARMPTYDEFINTGAQVWPETDSSRSAFIKLSAFEELVSPGIVILKSRPAVIIPIQRMYARQLLPETDPNRDMLARMYAGMSTERVYFSHSKAHGPMAPDGVAVFYESGDGQGAAVAMARITSVTDTTEREAKTNYVSRGVFALEDSEAAIKAITFANILKFDNPVPYQWMKSHAIIGGANLVTAQKIDTEQLVALLNYGQS